METAPIYIRSEITFLMYLLSGACREWKPMYTRCSIINNVHMVILKITCLQENGFFQLNHKLIFSIHILLGRNISYIYSMYISYGCCRNMIFNIICFRPDFIPIMLCTWLSLQQCFVHNYILIMVSNIKCLAHDYHFNMI